MVKAPLTALNEDRMYGPSTIFHSGLDRVIGDRPAPAPGDKSAGVLQRYVGGHGGQGVEPGQSFGTASGEGEGEGYRHQRLQAGGQIRTAGFDGPLAPGDGFLQPPGGGQVGRQGGGRDRSHHRLGAGVVRPPGLEQVGLGHRSPAAEQVEVAEQGAAPGAGTELADRRPQGQRRGHVGTAQQFSHRIEEQPLLVGASRAGRRCLGQPRRRLSRHAIPRRLSRRHFQVTGQAVIGPDRGSHPVSEGGWGSDQRGRDPVQPVPLSRAKTVSDRGMRQRVGESDVSG
jgi:hypothetical protein